MMTYEYKLLNYLIQGSAADQTKEAINDWNAVRTWPTKFLATVHDEINACAPTETALAAMDGLRLAMEKDRFDVPMLTEGFQGPNWHELESCI